MLNYKMMLHGVLMEKGPSGNVYIENLHEHLDIYAPLKNNHPKSKYFD